MNSVELIDKKNQLKVQAEAILSSAEKDARKLSDEKIESLITEEPNLTRDTIVEISNSKGTVKRRIDFSDTLRVLGVNPDSLPTIEKILEARKECEEG